MFKIVKLENQKELFLKTNQPKVNQKFMLHKQKPLTDKITNIKFVKEYTHEPNNTEISSKQKYFINSSENLLKPYNNKNTFKLSKIHRSKNTQNKTFDNGNSCVSNNRRIYNSGNFKVKSTKSFYNHREYDKEDILRKTNNSRLRKLYSMESNIFNLDKSLTNLVQSVPFYINPNLNNKINNIARTPESIHLQKENNHKNKNLKFFTLDDECKFDENLNNYSPEEEFIIKNARNRNINSIKKDKLNFDNKNYNKCSFLLNNNFSNSNFISFLHKIRLKEKTNESNIESVNYDIISNKSNNLYDKYNTLSNKKASNSQYENYEIIIPKNYNKLDSSKLKNFLHAQGIHYFSFKEDAVVSGDSGKFTFKIRKSTIDKKNDKVNNIEKLSKKLKQMFDVKLKKYDEVNKRKTTEITRKYGPEIIISHIKTEKAINKLLKR